MLVSIETNLKTQIMAKKYSYPWYIKQFEKAIDTAEKFILSVDETLFLQPPAKGVWSMGECYSHLINYGNLYYDDLAAAIGDTERTTDNPEQPFPPRWIVGKLVGWFEPPYKLKIKTVNPMKPDTVSKYNRIELLDEYVNLQERFIGQLEKGQHRHVDLGKVKMSHPLFSFVRLTLTETFALAEAHQRRHQWQAEQTQKVLKNST